MIAKYGRVELKEREEDELTRWEWTVDGNICGVRELCGVFIQWKG